MSNDPNDRFMISDLSSKLSAYINGGQPDQSSQTRDPAEIGDVFASEIRPAEIHRKPLGDELFTDLDQALDARPDSGEETVRNQKLAEEQRQRAEEAHRQQLRNEQQKTREEQQRQQKAREEQQRQQKLQEEMRQQKLRREKVIARSLAESLYSFDLDQTYTSVRSGHAVRYAKLSPSVRSMPSEEALRKAMAKTVKRDKASQAGAAFTAPREEAAYIAREAGTFTAAPQEAAAYEPPKTQEYYNAPQANASYEAQMTEAFSEVSSSETTQTAFAETANASKPLGESRYAKSPDPLYKGYQEESSGSKTAVVIALLIALLVIAAIFILIRRYSQNLTGFLSGTPAASTAATTSDAESEVDSKTGSGTDEDSRAAANTDSSAAAESRTAASMAINEEGDIFRADSEASIADDSGELIPEDPNDISYLASVNEKAAEDAIAKLTDADPRLYLSSYGVKISAGDSFNALSFVERIEDDSDDQDRLYRDISVDGLGDLDTKVPGTYELTFFCYDSAGNRSNRAKLTLIVE